MVDLVFFPESFGPMVGLMIDICYSINVHGVVVLFAGHGNI